MPDSDEVPGLSAKAGSPIFLSPRQREVLGWAARGCTDQEIARRLVLSVHTVRGYMAEARGRLGAVNTTHAVALAIIWGLIEVRLQLGMSGQDPGGMGGHDFARRNRADDSSAGGITDASGGHAGGGCPRMAEYADLRPKR